MPHLAFKTISTDDDEMLQLLVSAGDSMSMASMEAYLYPDQIQRFAAELEGFPENPSHEVILESGSPDPKWYGHLRMRAFVRDGSGHSAIEVLMDRRSVIPWTATHNFYLACNPADANAIGQQIRQWLANVSAEMRAEWRDA